MHYFSSYRARVAGFIVLSALWVGVSPVSGELVSIDFGADFRPDTQDTILLDDELADYGVLFSLPDVDDQVHWMGNYGIFEFALADSDPFGPNVANRVRIDFTDRVDSVQIRAFDGGGDIDTVTLSAYNALGDLLEQNHIIGVLGGFGGVIDVLSIGGDDIAYVTMETAAPVSGVFYDDLVFNVVPGPSGLAVLGLGAFVSCRRRRR